MKIFNLTVFLFVILVITACKKSRLSDGETKPETFREIFEQFWSKMNQQYVYWDQDATDWNAVYVKYSPLFDQLSNSKTDTLKSISYFKQITEGLIDGHYLILFKPFLLSDSTIDPGVVRRKNLPNYHEAYNYVNLVRTYLDNGYVEEKGNIIQGNKLISAISGVINGNALYFSCNFFALKQSHDAIDGNKLNLVLSYFFSHLNQRNDLIKGIIIDLRNNPGGNITDLDFFAGKLVDKDIVFGYSRSKSGLGKLNYFPWIEAKITHDPDYKITVPIILLGDNFSASLAETLIIAMKTQNKCLFIGEQTYGATGSLADASIFNSGSFMVGDFMSVQTSSAEFVDRNHQTFENKGIQPDINLPFNYKKVAAGIDEQLEKAIELINR